MIAQCNPRFRSRASSSSCQERSARQPEFYKDQINQTLKIRILKVRCLANARTLDPILDQFSDALPENAVSINYQNGGHNIHPKCDVRLRADHTQLGRAVLFCSLSQLAKPVLRSVRVLVVQKRAGDKHRRLVTSATWRRVVIFGVWLIFLSGSASDPDFSRPGRVLQQRTDVRRRGTTPSSPQLAVWCP